jgi:hypothetical protein
MGMELGVGAVLAVGQPVGVPAGEAVGVGVVLVGTVIEEQAEAGTVEFVAAAGDAEACVRLEQAGGGSAAQGQLTAECTPQGTSYFLANSSTTL